MLEAITSNNWYIPLKMLNKVSVALDITTDELKTSILEDHEKTLENYLNMGKKENTVHSPSEAAGPDFVTPQEAAVDNKFLKHG